MMAVETVDGRHLSIPAPGVLAHGAELQLPNEGLCGKVSSSLSIVRKEVRGK